MNKPAKIEPVTVGVHRKLSAARQKFHGLELRKTGKNTFAGYSYFELGDFLVPALKVFDEVGLGAVVSFDADTATMTICDLDNPEDRIVITSPMGSAALKGCHEVQNIGAVETYQRRYLWVAALEIVEHDALDKTTGKTGAEPEARANPSTGESPPPKRGNGKPQPGENFAAYEVLEGPYSSGTSLRGAIKAFAETLSRCADLGEFTALMETKDVVELEKQAMRYLPGWWETGEGCSADFEPVLSRITRKQRELEEIETLRNKTRTPIDAG